MYVIMTSVEHVQGVAARRVMPILSGRPANARSAPDSSAYADPLGMWNQYRRYVETLGKGSEMVIKRMDKWGINTIANWSSQK